MDLAILNDELVTDPLGRSYTSMTDEEAADDLNTVYRTRNIEQMSGSEVLQFIDPTEFNALSADVQSLVTAMLGMTYLNPWGVEADYFLSWFGPSNTITALNANRTEAISRGVELGIGIVSGGDVMRARAYGG